ncbi:MAG: ABC transporter substrate-binding protein [Eubacteriales bacterium]|nr:ABC transporter substrate-binding protein [Eubacteriales bacterium]
MSCCAPRWRRRLRAAEGGAGAAADAVEQEASEEAGAEEQDAQPEETGDAGETAQVNEVTDVTGRQVEVPANASHVVLLPGPAYEKTMILGVTDRVGGILKSCRTSWAELIHPEISDLVIFDSSTTPNVEEMMSLGAEFVICHDYAELNAQLDELQIPYVITQCSGELPYSDLEGFLAFQKTEINAIAEAFGGDALERAAAWCDYFDEKVSYVRERTDDLTDEERPRVYYARSDEGLVTFSQNSYPQYLVEMAGGNYVAKDTPEEMNSTLTIEQIMEWDPQIIFMGRMNDTSIITDNEAWSGISAVKEGKVYLSPSGVFNWDYSGESVLLMLYLAKNIHPDLFEDLNMEDEIKYYYETFYGYELSDENVQNILNHMDPAAQ